MDGFNNIKAVLFDFDDTLANREAYAFKCFEVFLKERTDITDPVEFETLMQDVMLWDEKGNIRKSHILNELERKYGISVPVEEFETYWAENLWRYCVPFEDSERTLEYLSGKYRIGIITNGPSEGQRKKIEQSGLGRFFKPEHIIVSGDYPYNKPDVRMFEKGCAAVGVDPSEAVFVGDIFSNDVLGAYRAGMHPVWIWTAGYRSSLKSVPVIHKISDLIDFL